MPLTLWNTRTRRLEVFEPLHPPTVGLYTCGPTVYGSPHIGNLRSYLFADTLRRVLNFNSYQVRQVMNITDVGHLTHDADSGEEKMDVAARAEGVSPLTIAARYTALFKENLAALNIAEPDVWAPATEHIPEQIALVERLIARGHAYETAEAVYFDVATFPSYGALTGQKLGDKKIAARDKVETDPEKHHPADFALWFKRTGRFATHILYWPSPWGDGFPGWHIECSAMSMKYLGEQFDIHTGGVDHILPHHSNEIAQSEAATGKVPFVNIWMHGEFLILPDKRMGKSEGNTITLADVIARGIDPLAFRYLVLQTHYRKKLSFSWEALEAANTGLRHLRLQIAKLGQDASGTIEVYADAFRDTVNNDLAIPEALTIIRNILQSSDSNTMKKGTINKLERILGLRLDRVFIPQPSQKLINRVHPLIVTRNGLRQKKLFEKADNLRRQINDLLESERFALEDDEDGEDGVVFTPLK